MDLALLEYLQGFLTENRKALFNKILQNRTRHFAIATEDVYQLHNTSAVMRSCDVFGIQDLHIIEEIGRKKIDKEIAMGAQKWVSLHRYSSVNESITQLKNNGYRIIATTPHTESTYLHNFDITQKAVFFFGKENDGLSDFVLAQADESLKIPMYGFTESLNISVSAAIVMQYVITKLKQSSIDWRLTDDEKLEITLEWTKKTIKNVDEIIERYYSTKS